MKTINIQLFKEMLEIGNLFVSKEYEYINDLNVFPVPDGDTGSNMKTTINGAIVDLNTNQPYNFKQLASIFSRGLLMNARGNSGVILSQIFRGFMEGLAVESDEISIDLIINSLKLATKRAYDGVSNPVEGTILTVIRVIDEKTNERHLNQPFDNVNQLFEYMLDVGIDILNKTPDMHPSLKEANVVDSGGYGLVCFLKGMTYKLLNKVDEVLNDHDLQQNQQQKKVDKNAFIGVSNEEEGFGYCSEIIMVLGSKIEPNAPNKAHFNLQKYKQELSKIGDSLVVVQDDDLVKVHIHTFKPHKLLQISQKYGEFSRVKFDNMTNQFYENIKQKEQQQKQVTNQQTSLNNNQIIIATVPSQSFKNLLLNDHGIEHTFVTEENGAPSIQDFVDLITKASSSQIFIITDDSNIILSAEQAANLVVANGINVSIIPSRNMFESLIAISHFEDNVDFKTNTKQMQKAVKKAHSSIISKSIKDVEYPHIKVKKDDFIGIVDKKIISSNHDEAYVLQDCIEVLIKSAKQPEICHIYYGMDASPSVIAEVEKYISEKYGVIFDIHYTSQKLYLYYLGVQ